jgi:hypothetical protein
MQFSPLGLLGFWSVFITFRKSKPLYMNCGEELRKSVHVSCDGDPRKTYVYMNCGTDLCNNVDILKW